MPAHSTLVEQLLLVFVLALVTILAQPLGRRTGLSPAVTVTVLGLVLALLPFVPNISVDPDLILPLVLPPLLYASARTTSWRHFAVDTAPILLRAVGLVVVSAVVTAIVFHAIYPAVPLAAALVLGSVVAPPDPVAFSAVAQRLGLPHRLIAVLEGEGLFNDVTAVVLYNVAVHAVVSGHFSAWGAAGELLLSALVGAGVGLALGWAGSWLMRRLDEATWQVATGLLLPFAAYGLADVWHGSAVLAVLVCTLYLTDAATDFSDTAYRIVGDSCWEVIDLLVTGIAFGLIGLELTTVLAATGPGWPRLLGGVAAVTVVVVFVRLAWLLATTGVSRHTPRHPRADKPHTWREAVVTWWAGLRGVVTVALALAVPLHTASGAPFPGRATILFTAFVVVLFTLLVQGPTLPALVGGLGVRANTEVERTLERALWRRILAAELAALNDIAHTQDLPDEVYQRLRENIEYRLVRADPGAARAPAVPRAVRLRHAMHAISHQVLEAGRTEALAARREPDMPPDLVDRMMRRLDLGTGSNTL